MIRRWPLVSYFTLAWGISWLLWLPRIASEQGWIGWFVPEWWHYAGAAGPIVAALLVAARTEGRSGVRGLLGQFNPRRAPGGWLLFAIVSPVALFGLGAVVLWIVESRWPTYQDVAQAANLPALGLPLTFLVHVVTFGIGEETGWRGFALPRLQARHSALTATLILAVGWAIWHIPSFFENAGYTNLGPVTLIGWSIGLVLGAVFLTWLYNSTRGSLLAIVLWHGLFNTFITSQAAEGLIAAVMTTGVMLLAVFAIVAAGTRELRGLSRSAGPRQQHEPDSQRRDKREAA
jgi:CAAX protease family protein